MLPPVWREKSAKTVATMFSGSSRKPYTAITVQIDRLTSEQYEEEDVSGIIDLVEVVRIQESGPTEAARAVRKKLKYGNSHRQIRALVILDGLIQNAGGRFQRTFADEPLLERLRLMARDEMVDARVRHKCKVLFNQWANNYKNIAGLERIANLYQEFPKTQTRTSTAARQKVLQDTGSTHFDCDSASSRPSSKAHSHFKPAAASHSRPNTPSQTSSGSGSKIPRDKKGTAGKPFDLSKEKDDMTKAIANASIASINLLNGLQLINREKERVSENKEVNRQVETCKNLRRKIMHYIQRVESDDWIGSLVNANDELVKALTAYDVMDKSVSDDSDSDAYENNRPSGPRSYSGETKTVSQQLTGLSLHGAPPKPPRPGAPTAMTVPPKPTPAFAQPKHTSNEDDHDDNDDDDDDPFGDSHATRTPTDEQSGMTWREV